MAPRRVRIAEANSGGRNKKNLSIQGGYEKSTNGQADVLTFGPIVELASGKLLVTLNPLFTGQVGPNRETEGLGFDYGWRMISQSIGGSVWKCSAK